MAFLFVRNFLRRGHVGFRDHVARDFPLELFIRKVLVHTVLELAVADADVETFGGQHTIDLTQHL